MTKTMMKTKRRRRSDGTTRRKKKKRKKSRFGWLSANRQAQISADHPRRMKSALGARISKTGVGLLDPVRSKNSICLNSIKMRDWYLFRRRWCGAGRYTALYCPENRT